MRRRRTAHRFGEKRRTTDVLIEEKVDFSGLMLSSYVLEGLKSAGFEIPSPIQLKAIPLGRCGLDLIAQAKSGTGKTCVFSVIALENINLAVTSTQVLVLAPTREIAVQIRDVMCSIGRHLKGLQAHVFIGGMPLGDDKNRLKQCHIAIGTPGRVKHLIENQLLQTRSIRLFILDEADKLLEESFQTQINWIYSTLPGSKQVLALSATYPDHLAEQLKNYMKDPTFVRLNAADPALEGIRHYRCVVPFHSLPHKVFHEKAQSLLQLLSKLSFHQCLIFSNYQIRAKNLSETLAKNGWPSTYISGNQGQNERLKAMAKLKEFKCRILISTDLTSRGIDAERVNLVINMDMPHDSETYLHRVGRAGRFGSYGVAVNFVAEGKESTSLNEIEANCGVTITPLPDDVSKLLSEEIIQEVSQQESLKKVNSSDRFGNEATLDKMAIDHKTSDNQNGRFTEKENVEVCLHEDAEIHPQKTEDKTERHNATIGGEGNMTEANSKVDGEHNQEAEYQPDKNEGRDIQNVGTADNTIEEKNIQAGFDKDNEPEHKEAEKLTVNADQEDDTQQEAGKESFVVEHQDTGNGINNTGIETSCLQRNIVNTTSISGESERKKNELNDEEKLSEISGHEIDHEERGRHEIDHEKRGTHETDHEEQGTREVDHEERGRHEIDHGERRAREIDDEERETHEVDHEERGRHKTDDEERRKYKINQEEQNDLSDNKNHQNNTEDTKTSENSKIIFRNYDTGLFATAEQCDEEDFVSDDSESECSTSEETESSVESRGSHTPISCKDFDNALEAYLAGTVDGNSNTRSDNSECKSRALSQSRDINDDNQVNDASKNEIYANVQNEIDANACAQSPCNFPQSNPNESRPMSTNNASNSQDTMFYGATSDDVNAYMTALPAEWTNTWYRVYNRQTSFIMKYTKFCQENF